MMNRSDTKGCTRDTRGNIFAAIELSSTAWVIALHLPTRNKISLVRATCGDVDRLLEILERARTTVNAEGVTDPQIHTCYEAGYDGFWLHRLLVAKGIRNQVLDSASIQVSRRHRNAKTDRIDAEGLVRVLMALHRGETKVCSVVHVPTAEDEDVKRLHRSRQTLINERVRHVNRIKGLLKLQGVHHIEPNREGWMNLLADLQTCDGRSFPVRLMQEIRREAKLLAVVKDLFARGLCRDRCIGATRFQTSSSAQARRGASPDRGSIDADPWYRSDLRFRVCHRGVLSQVRQSPSCCKLRWAHTHSVQQWASNRDQGISKAGNACARHYAVELAWLWLRNQPTSRLTAWFKERVTTAKGRVRRVAIVALARKLIVALWRFVETGLVPDGVVLKR